MDQKKHNAAVHIAERLHHVKQKIMRMENILEDGGPDAALAFLKEGIEAQQMLGEVLREALSPILRGE